MNSLFGSNIDNVRAEIMRLETAPHFDADAWSRVLADLESACRVSTLADAKRRMETARSNQPAVAVEPTAEYTCTICGHHAAFSTSQLQIRCGGCGATISLWKLPVAVETPRVRRKDQCKFCTSRRCYNRIATPDLSFDEVACRRHSRDLALYADMTLKGALRWNIDSTGTMKRGQSLETYEQVIAGGDVA